MSMPPQNQFGACPNCGTPYGLAGQPFCARCGAAQPVAPAAPVYAPQPPASEFPPASPYRQPDAAQQQHPYQQPAPSYGQQPAWGGPPQGYGPAGSGVDKGVVAAILGVVVVLAMVVGLVMIGIARNNSTADVTPPASAFPGVSFSPTLIVPTMPPAVVGGSITFAPAILSCANAVDFVMTTILPASVKSGDSISLSLDGHDSGQTSVTNGGTTTQQADGSWVDTSTSTAAEMQKDCDNGGANSAGIGVLTPGLHTMTIYDAAGNVLASGSYLVTDSGPSATATAATPIAEGSIVFVPSSLSCSAPVDFITIITLPATVKSGDVITETLDGALYGTGTVSDSEWTHMSDGTWTSTSTDTAAQVGSACSSGEAVLATGTHVVKLFSATDELLAVNQYSVTP